MKDVEETFRQLLQKIRSLLHKQIHVFGYMYLDEDFAIN